MERRFVIFLCFAIATVMSMKTPLYVGGLFSIPEDLATGTKSYHSLVGSQMAIEDINELSEILLDYEIVLLYTNTEVSD